MQIDFPDTMGYTFGDNQQASRRLHRLAEVYESETRDLLNAVRSEFCGPRLELALDLGCGPGWSTQLIKASVSPKRTVGLDSSESYVAEARINQPQLEFIRHDVLMTPFPLDNADMIFLPVSVDTPSITACCSRNLVPCCYIGRLTRYS